MTTDLKDVLMELDSKIAEVYNLELAEEMTDIYIDLKGRIDELSINYWKLVEALARTEKDRDDLLSKLKIEKKISKSRSEDRKVVFEIAMEKIEEERKIQDKLDKEKDQAEYDKNYYRDEVECLRKELEYEKIRSESLMKSLHTCIDTTREVLEYELEIQDKLYKERDQAEYDRDYYRNEIASLKKQF